MTNVVGWDELYNGSLVSAAYTMYDYYMGNTGWPITILFFVFQYMLYIKTKNLNLMFVTAIFFVSMFAVSTFVQPLAVEIMFAVLVFELAGIIYLWLFG